MLYYVIRNTVLNNQSKDFTMARPGITYINVAKAAEIIVDQEKNPTVDRVLAYLGTGSKSTIAPLLKQWKAEKSQIVDTSSLPNDIIAAASSLYEQLQQTADLKVQQAKDNFQSQVNDWQKKLDEANEKIAHLQKITQQDSETQQILTAENDELKSHIEAMTIRIAKFEGELSKVQEQLSDKKSIIQEQKDELQQMRFHFEHYQQQTAEERQREHDQFQTVTNQFDRYIAELNQYLEDEKNSKKIMDERNAQLKIKSEQLRQEILEINHKNNQLELQCVTYKGNITTLNQSNNDIKQQIINLKEKLEEISEVKQKTKINYQLLHQRYQQIKQKLMEASEQSKTLTEENKILLQEKSILQGQLKQICEVKHYKSEN